MEHFLRTEDPSPEQIAAACLEIQSEWTPTERARRWQHHSREWLPPGATRHMSPADLTAKELGRKGGGRIRRALQWDAGDLAGELDDVHAD